jgi:hypothetical protein
VVCEQPGFDQQIKLWLKFRVFWDDETICTSEMLVNFNVTIRHYIPEDSKLHTRCHENLKSSQSCGCLSSPYALTLRISLRYSTICWTSLTVKWMWEQKCQATYICSHKKHDCAHVLWLDIFTLIPYFDLEYMLDILLLLQALHVFNLVLFQILVFPIEDWVIFNKFKF